MILELAEQQNSRIQSRKTQFWKKEKKSQGIYSLIRFPVIDFGVKKCFVFLRFGFLFVFIKEDRFYK